MKNRSGMFETHLRTAHGIDKYNFIENFPEYREYFSQIKDPVSLRQFENDTDKFVTCKICGKKLSRIGTRHLSTHGITKEQYIALYGISDMISKEFYNKSIKNIEYYNHNCEHAFHSSDEKEIVEFIRNLGFDCKNDRDILNGKEIDIYIDNIKIGFEYDGILWHSEIFGGKNKFYHVNKTDNCLCKNVHLYHIFEDEYNLKKDVVRYKIMNILNTYDSIIKLNHNTCHYSLVDKDDAISFIEKYSMLYPHHNCDVYIGAFYGKELVVLYGLSDNILTHYGDNYCYVYNGVHEALFNFMLLTYHVDNIISYDDRRWVVKYNMSIYIIR